MNTIGIPYQPRLVLAKLKGLKTQTRRVITHFDGTTYAKDPNRIDKVELRDGRWHFWEKGHGSTSYPIYSTPSRRGNVGDYQHWQEAFDFGGFCGRDVNLRYKADQRIRPVYDAEITDREASLMRAWKSPKRGEIYRGMPAMFMLPSLSRGLDLIVEVRCQRLQDMTDEDAIAEGLECGSSLRKTAFTGDAGKTWWHSPTLAFMTLWNHTNAARGYGWNLNPWVFCYTTKNLFK